MFNIFLLTLILSYVVTRLVKTYARKFLIDVPNERSSHSMPTPRGGGLGIVIAFYIGVCAFSIVGISLDEKSLLFGGIPIVIISWFDDHRHVPIKYRLLAQLAGSIWLLASIGIDHFPLLYDENPAGLLIKFFLVLILIMWFINLFNFMDGIDGLAGSEFASIMVSVIIMILISDGLEHKSSESIMISALGLCASLGFIIMNWPPAKIFMGDVGSDFLGFLIAVIAIKTIHQQELGVITWLILPAVFWVDATTTLITRIASGQAFYKAHRTHAYQHIAVRFESHKLVTQTVLIINLMYLLPLALMAQLYKDLQYLCLFLSYLPLVIVARYFRAGRDETGKLSR